jgi:hypothetical protein
MDVRAIREVEAVIQFHLIRQNKRARRNCKDEEVFRLASGLARSAMMGHA